MAEYDRSAFNLEKVHNRRIATGDFSLDMATVGELDYLLTVAKLWRDSNRESISGIGTALAVTVDAERARREWDWNAEQGQFDAITAETPELLPTGDMAGIERWSELPPDEVPELPPEQ